MKWTEESQIETKRNKKNTSTFPILHSIYIEWGATKSLYISESRILMKSQF